MADIPSNPTGMGSVRSGSATEEMKDRASQLKEHVKGAVPELRERMSDIKEDVRALASSAGHAALEQLDPVEDYVRRFPLRSLLIAGGVGLVLGIIVRR